MLYDPCNAGYEQHVQKAKETLNNAELKTKATTMKCCMNTRKMHIKFYTDIY